MARPPFVSAAGVILVVLGGLGALAGVLLVLRDDLAGSGMVGTVDLRTVSRVVGAVALVVGAVEIWAGVLVLRLSSLGRILGLVLSALGVIGGLRGLGGGPLDVISLGLYGVVIYALLVHRRLFRPGAGR